MSKLFQVQVCSHSPPWIDVTVIKFQSMPHHWDSHPADLQRYLSLSFFLCFVTTCYSWWRLRGDRRGSARRASVALIRVICTVQRRRLFLGAAFSGFSRARAPQWLPALMVGGSDEYALCSCSEMRKASMRCCCDGNPKPRALWLTARTDTIKRHFQKLCNLFLTLWYMKALLKASRLPHHKPSMVLDPESPSIHS